MASLFSQPYISPPDYDTEEFPSKNDILLVQQSAVNEYERCQQGNTMDRKEVPPQQVDAGGMRMMNNALWIPERAVELQLRWCVEAHCRSADHRAYEATLGPIKEYVAWTTMAKDVKVLVQNCLHCIDTIPGDKGMDNDGEGRQGLSAELFALYRYNSWRQSATPAGYAATRIQAQRDPALRLPVHWVVKRQEVSVLATSQG
jgi:Integrase zinc binding domain